MLIKEISKRPEAHMAAARELAATALTYLASDPERLVRFMGETGLTPQTLRESASQKDFGAAILAYILADEPLLLAFSDAQGLKPEHVAGAHEILAPGFDPDAIITRAD